MSLTQSVSKLNSKAEHILKNIWAQNFLFIVIPGTNSRFMLNNSSFLKWVYLKPDKVLSVGESFI